MDRDEILRVFEAFRAAGLEYTLIGATAMGVHGIVRATEDLDLFIRATPENVSRAAEAWICGSSPWTTTDGPSVIPLP